MKKTLLTITLLASTCIAIGQGQSGFTLSLREDLVDISMNLNDNYNPIHTAYSHIFGTELSVGYREVFNRHWSVGLSAGLMLHDYSWTNVFSTQDPTTTTFSNGSTQTTYDIFSGNLTLNMPLIIDVKYRFSDWADKQMWDVIPLLSARLGYVLGLVSINEQRYNKQQWPDGPYGVTAGELEEYDYGKFNKQGVHFSLGIGLTYNQFDFELEYAMQPNNYVLRHTEKIQEAGSEAIEYNYGPSKHAFAAGDGFTLRMTYNF